MGGDFPLFSRTWEMAVMTALCERGNQRVRTMVKILPHTLRTKYSEKSEKSLGRGT